MGTAAIIGMRTPDGIKSIRVNHDGYVGHTGAILGGWYNTPERIAALIDLGELSIIGPRIAPNPGEKHNWAWPAEGVTVAYKRDRGEERAFHMRDYPSDEEFAEVGMREAGAEYAYLFDGGAWHVAGIIPGKKYEFVKLDVKGAKNAE